MKQRRCEGLPSQVPGEIPVPRVVAPVSDIQELLEDKLNKLIEKESGRAPVTHPPTQFPDSNAPYLAMGNTASLAAAVSHLARDRRLTAGSQFPVTVPKTPVKERAVPIFNPAASLLSQVNSWP